MDKRAQIIRRLRTIAALALVAMYVAGLIAMLAGSVRLASILWVVSTLGGIGLLYWIKTAEKNRKLQQEAEQGGESPEA